MAGYFSKTSLLGGHILRFALVLHCLCLVALFSAEIAIAEQARAPRQLRIASEGARPPYNYLDGNDLAGFEIELGKALCAEMKAQCNFVVQDWDGMIPALNGKHFDAIMAAMEINDERREKIAFSKPYVRMPSVFLMSKKSDLKDSSPEGLAGQTIGVESGGTHQAYLEDAYKKSELKKYASLEEAILDMAEGRIDVAIGDKDAVTDFMTNRKEAQCCHLLADVPRDANYFGEGIGIGLRKDEPELKAEFDKALDALIANGEFGRIRAKFFPFEVL
jgi:polar amino acid transport system substrate-binding protein